MAPDPRLCEKPLYSDSDGRTRDRRLSVLIVGTSFDFPHGGGASSRVYCYAKGLAASGAEVRIVSLVMPRRGRAADDTAAAGVYEDLRYEYACGTRVRPTAFWRRRLLWVRRAARTATLVRQTAGRSPGDCVVLIYSEVSSWILGLAILARVVGGSSVLDLCEFPLVWRPRNLRTSIHRTLRTHLACRLTDGIVPISAYLEDYVRVSSRRPLPMVRVPVMVDLALFADDSARGEGETPRRVLYCGALSHFDEVERTLRIFAAAAAGQSDVRLMIVGGGPAALREKAGSIADSLGLEQRVEFVDRLTREDLAATMLTAEVFVLPRAAGIFSQAGLPNKLGEYLAVGRPVVVTANGDIALYLRDGTDAYLVEPGDDAAFAARLKHALTHRSEATEVGARGRDVAITQFDYRLQGARIRDFLEQDVLVKRQTLPVRGAGASHQGDH